MRIMILAAGRIEELPDGYAVRLIEQGRAVPAPPENESKRTVPNDSPGRKGTRKKGKG